HLNPLLKEFVCFDIPTHSLLSFTHFPVEPPAGHGSLRLLLSLSCCYIPFFISITASLSLLLMTSLFLFKCVFNMRVGKRFMAKT
ncbi:hypothetical protein L873DRAFT_1821445, partial [Choiromyces venosus 120613-1]